MKKCCTYINKNKLIENKQIFNYNISKKNFNYYLDKHQDNSINKSLKAIKELNIRNIPEYELSKTSKFQPYNSFVYHENNFSSKFMHQTLGCVLNSKLLNNTENEILPEAKELAKFYNHNVKLGAYSDSNGLISIRENIKEQIQLKYNIENIDIKDLFFTNGGLQAYEHIVATICNKDDSVMIPNPCYPHLSNINTSRKLNNISYLMNEKDNWSIDFDDLRNTFAANKNICPLKALVMFYPHDPTGKIHTRKEVEKLIMFCYEHKVALISIETNKNSILNREKVKNFVPALKILDEMPAPIRNKTTLFTVTGLTKGFPNMSSLRSGLVHCHNLDPFVHSQLTKYKSIDLCSSIISQIGYDLVHGHDYNQLFGNDFVVKYDDSIEVVNRHIIKKKEEILKYLHLDYKNVFTFNDIESGLNLFIKLKYLSVNTFIKRYYKSHEASGDLIEPGYLYGLNRDDMLNLIIHPNYEYDFLHSNNY